MRVFATIRPKPEYFTQAREALAEIAAPTRDEPGCLRFDVYVDVASTVLILDESWTDAAAFDFHHAQPYTKKVFAAYENWLQSPTVVVELSPVDIAA